MRKFGIALIAAAGFAALPAYAAPMDPEPTETPTPSPSPTASPEPAPAPAPMPAE